VAHHQLTARNKQTRLSLLSNEATVKPREINLFTLQSLHEQDQYKGAVVKGKTPTDAAKDQQSARQQVTSERQRPHKQRDALIPRAEELQVHTEDYKVI